MPVATGKVTEGVRPAPDCLKGASALAEAYSLRHAAEAARQLPQRRSLGTAELKLSDLRKLTACRNLFPRRKKNLRAVEALFSGAVHRKIMLRTQVTAAP